MALLLVTGRGADAARYSARLKSNTENFHKQFYNGADKAPKPGTRCCYDSGSQTSNIQALILNAVPSGLQPSVLKTFVASIHNRNASASPTDETTATRLALAHEQADEQSALDPRRKLESLRLASNVFYIVQWGIVRLCALDCRYAGTGATVASL